MSSKKYSSKNSCVETADKEEMRYIVLTEISEAIRQIKYGSVQIHIQDGRVIQIDKISKSRID